MPTLPRRDAGRKALGHQEPIATNSLRADDADVVFGAGFQKRLLLPVPVMLAETDFWGRFLARLRRFWRSETSAQRPEQAA